IGTYRKIARKMSGATARLYSGQSRRSARLHAPGRRFGGRRRGFGSSTATSADSITVIGEPPSQSADRCCSSVRLDEALASTVEQLEVARQARGVELGEVGVPLIHIPLAHDELQRRGVHGVLERGGQQRGLLELGLVERSRRERFARGARGEHVVDVL